MCLPDTKSGRPCASWGRTRVQGVCQFLLMVTLIDCHTAGQIDCAARDLADCGTPVSGAAVRYAVTI